MSILDELKILVDPALGSEKEISVTLTYRPPFKVKLTYFKDTGKYYSEGEYESRCLQLYAIWDEVRDMLRKGKRPGLVDGHSFPYVLIEVPDHPHAHPRLCIVKEGEAGGEHVVI